MIYRLGTYELDPANFLLTANGRPVPVEPLVFDLIICLIENRDRVLTRQELFDRLWAGRIVSDTSLSNHVKSARKALGDDGHKQQVIKTIHGRGYRFVAAIEEISGDAIDGDKSRADRPARTRFGNRIAVFGIALLLLVAVGGQILLNRPGESVESIAVLPLKNLSNDPEQQYFVEGMQDALITRLSRTTGLRVISKTSTMRYASSDASIPQIARELNVDALVEGSILRDEDQVRISAQLILGSEDAQLWAGSYDRDLDHVLALINEISSAIADEIEVAVTPALGERAEVKPVDIKVHELALKGRHYFERFMFEESLGYYQQAVEWDAEFAPGHAGVAGCYFVMELFNRAPEVDLIPKAREAALRSIALDSNSSEGIAALGSIQLYFDWDWEAARNNLIKALELNPNDGLTRHAYADYLMVVGDLEESLKQVEIGLLYDPLSPMAKSVVDYHRLFVHSYDEVIENGRDAIAGNPEAVVDLPFYQEALWLSGMHEEAYAAYRKTWGRNEELLEAMDKGYADSGHSGAVLALAAALAGRVPDFDDYVTLAKLYVRGGRPDTALAWLEEAYRTRQPQILHVQAMPVFEELHASPKFQDLLRRIGFPETEL